MVRSELAQRTDSDPDFSWRGREITRLEYLSDIVFALAFGMIVMSSNEPRTFEELNRFLFTLFPVTGGFMVMVSIWNAHFTFFRRYGLADPRVISLNAVLLLVVLFIAYPLRFIFDSLFGFVLMLFGDYSVVEAMNIDYRRAGVIMSYFATGLTVVRVLFAVMYAHALSFVEVLGLSDQERRVTKAHVLMFTTGALWSATAAALAFFTPLGGFAGFLSFFDRPTNAFISWCFRPRT